MINGVVLKEWKDSVYQFDIAIFIQQMERSHSFKVGEEGQVELYLWCILGCKASEEGVDQLFWIRSENVEDSVPPWEDIIEQLLKGNIIYLVDLYSISL